MTAAPPTPSFSGPSVDLPRWLAELHRRTPVDGELDLHLDPRPPLEPDPGSSQETDRADAIQPVSITDVLVGAGFDPQAPADPRGRRPKPGVHVVRRLRTLPDWVGPDLRALIVGLNPSPASADGAVAFARPGNRFWPAVMAAGLVSVDRDPEHAIAQHGIGFTDLVKRTTRTAAELSNDDYRTGVARLDRLVGWLAPERVIIVGLTGWRAARDRKATAGWQPGVLGARPVYLMPNTSGLNAHTTLDGFVNHFQTAMGAKPD